MAEGKKYYGFVDNMRAMGMLLIAAIHAPGWGEYITSLLSGIGVPLFFFVSGMLIPMSKKLAPFSDNLKEYSRKLLLPYLLFFLFSWLYWIVTFRLGNSANVYIHYKWWYPLEGLLFGSGELLYVNPALWFFPALWMTTLLYFIFSRYFKGLAVWLLAIVVSVAFVALRTSDFPRLPWGLDNALASVIFFSAGNYFAGKWMKWFSEIAKLPAALLATLCFVLYMLLYTVNGSIDVNSLNFGNGVVTYFTMTLFGIGAILFVSKLWEPPEPFKWISRNSIFIFPTHMVFYRIFTGVFMEVFHFPATFKEDSFLWGIVYVLLAFMLAWPASMVLKKYFHFFFSSGRPFVPS